MTQDPKSSSAERIHSHDHSHSPWDNHDHSHSHAHFAHAGHHHHVATQNIAAALLLNLAFTVIEILGGAFTGSLAILADAVHDLGDTLSLAIAWYLQKLSNRKPDAEYSYGYRRFSMLAAVISGLVILTGSVFVLKETLPRFLTPSLPHGQGMLWLAILGVCVNGYAALRLTQGSSHNERMLSWHLIEDAAGWGIVLIGSIFVIWKKWTWVDPFMAAGLSFFVIFNVFRQLRKTVEVFLQKIPGSFDLAKFRAFCLSVQGVSDIHDIHVWSLDGERNILSLHVVLKDAAQKASEVKAAIQKFVTQWGSFHTTIETEILGEPCHENCDDNR